MSTRGSFIIRKNHIDKELYVGCDAYPSYTGRDVVRLIKSVDLSRLYDLLMTRDDLVDTAPESEDAPLEVEHGFSLSLCEDAVYTGSPYVYERMNERFIEDSLYCEYAYVLDLDAEELLFFRGFQRRPQAGNPYGHNLSFGEYYPCRLCAVFSFAYVRQAHTAAIVELMEAAEDRDSTEIHMFRSSSEHEATS